MLLKNLVKSLVKTGEAEYEAICLWNLVLMDTAAIKPSSVSERKATKIPNFPFWSGSKTYKREKPKLTRIMQVLNEGITKFSSDPPRRPGDPMYLKQDRVSDVFYVLLCFGGSPKMREIVKI